MEHSRFLRTLFMLCGLILFMSHEALYAEGSSARTATMPNLTVEKIPAYKLCPDLKASIILAKSSSGLVTITGRVTNVGVGDYNMASLAEVVMNLAYAPRYSYNKTGVSDILLSKSFTALKRGASLTVSTSYQIPDFGGWAIGGLHGNAKRLFTLRIIKQDMASYTSGEDCHPENNSVSEEVIYRELKH